MPETMESVESKPRVDKNLFDLLLKLTNNDSDCRIDACVDTLQLLQGKQDGVENAELMCDDLKYTVERLVKGLASSRDSARLGFSLLLTKILKHMPVVLIEDVLEIMKKHLLISRQEKRDHIIGQLLTYSAIVCSGRLAEHSQLSFVVTSIHDLWQGRGYVLNACYKILVSLFTQLTQETFKDTLWPEIKKYFSSGWETCSADVLWFLLLCIRIFPGSIPEKFLKKHWNNRDVFAPENHDYLKKIFKQTTSCLPMLHPLCIEFSIMCLSRKDMKDVWNSIVDDNFFDNEQSEKAYVGFELIKRVLQDAKKKKIIEVALSPKFRALFVLSFLNKKYPMHPAATHLANFLCDFVKQNKDPKVQIIILKVFLQPPGSLLTDQVFKKKEVVAIIQNLLPDAVKLYCEYLKSLVVKRKTDSSENGEENGSKLKGFQAVTQIGAIVCHPITISDVEWRLDVIKFLFLHSFFTVKKPAELLHCEAIYDEITPTLRESLRHSFYRAVSSLHQKTEKQISPAEQFLQSVSSFGEYVESLLSATEFVEPIFPYEKVAESWQKLKSIIHKLNKQSKKDGKASESHAFQVLFLELSLHLFHDAEHMTEVLEELHVCCKKALRDRKHADKTEEESESEPPWVAVVTDILLSLLSRPSQHLRNAVTFVFPFLIPFITSEALQQILNVINPVNSEEPMLVDESEGESDAEFDSGSSSNESDGDDPNPKVDNEFREKVKKALGHAAEVSDAESVILSDSEMFKLDEHIAEAFKSRVATGHTQMSEEDKAMLNFRLRCLDLVIAFLKSEPPLHLVLQCVEPVLAAFELGHKGKNQGQLLHKILTTFQTFLTIKKFKHYDVVEKSYLEELIKKMIEKCHKETNLNTAKKLYSLCVFLFLCSRRFESQRKAEKKSSKKPWYLKPYISAIDEFVKLSSSSMFPQFFVQLMQKCPEVAFHFISPCKKHGFSSDARLYKKTQCLGLLFEALKFSKSQNSITSEEWEKVGSDLVKSAAEVLKEILPNESKPTYLTELLDIILMCHTIVLEKTSISLIEEHKDLVPVLEAMEEKNIKLPKKGKATRRKIINCLKNETNNKRKLNFKNEERKKPKLEPEDE